MSAHNAITAGTADTKIASESTPNPRAEAVARVSTVPRSMHCGTFRGRPILPSRREILTARVEALPRWNQRWIMRLVVGLFGRDIVGATGLENLRSELDPCILAINHSTRLEALLLPSWLTYLRGGHLIRFIADWNFALIPGIGGIMRAGECIFLVRKPAKPAFLNVFKAGFERKGPAFTQAEAQLRLGRSVGIFPEGTTNRHPTRLLRGFEGAAKLSLRTGCPLVPVGIRFPGQSADQPIRDRSPMEVNVGEPLHPGIATADPGRDEVREWHARMMTEIARLSGKRWEPASTRRKHHGFD